MENLRKVDSGAYAFGVVYSGHVYQGRNGLMKNDPKKYEKVLGVSYFYGAPAQLVVKKGGGIKSIKDLAGKKVGVQLGTTGDIWLTDETEAEVVRYEENTLAFQALAGGDVDAAAAAHLDALDDTPSEFARFTAARFCAVNRADAMVVQGGFGSDRVTCWADVPFL